MQRWGGKSYYQKNNGNFQCTNWDYKYNSTSCEFSEEASNPARSCKMEMRHMNWKLLMITIDSKMYELDPDYVRDRGMLTRDNIGLQGAKGDY